MSYRSPGTEVLSEFEPLANPNASGDRLLTLIGEIDTEFYPEVTVEYRRTASTDAGTIKIPVPSLGTIADIDRVVSVYDYSTEYTAVTDYVVTVTTDTTAAEITVTLTWNPSGSAPLLDNVYYVKIRKEFPRVPGIYTKLDDVSSAFGQMISTVDTGSLNKLVVAAYLAFNEGAPSVMIAPYDSLASAGNGNIDDAFRALAAISDPTIVVGLFNDKPSDNQSNWKLVQHVLQTSSQLAKKYRVGVIGTDLSAVLDANIAAAYNTEVLKCNSQRIVLVGPSEFKTYLPIPPSGQQKEYTLKAEYLAVITGAMWSRPEYTVATSLTRKASATINSLVKQFDDIQMDIIASKGITLFANLRANIVVRDDITTKPDTILTAEPNITMIADDIAKSAIAILDGSIIGQPLDSSTLVAVRTRLVTMLEQKLGKGIIQKKTRPVVEQESLVVPGGDPRKITVKLKVMPTFATKFIDIKVNYVAAL
jgi:hypothetical protein